MGVAGSCAAVRRAGAGGLPEVKATLVPDKLTPCTAADVVRVFRSAMETVTGVTPKPEHLAVLVAQSALETGRWKSLHCWNFGNVKASASYEWLYCQFRCNEVINGKVVWFDPPHPQCNFRAFTSIDTGALDHIRFLSLSKRYARAWAAAISGDPATFVHALKASGYFTADEKPYLKAVLSLFREFLPLCQSPDRDTEPPPPEPDEASLHYEALLAKANYAPVKPGGAALSEYESED